MRQLRVALCGLLLAMATAGAQQEMLQPGENLAIKGIPPIPRSILTSISTYSENRQASVLSWVGTSREILICTRLGAAYQIHRVAMPGGARRQLTFVPDGIFFPGPEDDSMAPSRPDGSAFVYTRDIGAGSERTQLFLYDFATAKTTLLTDPKARSDAPVWSRDGKLLAFTSTSRNGGDWDIWVMDPADPASNRMLAEFSGTWKVLDWSGDGTTLLARQNVAGFSQHKLWLVDVKTGAQRELTPGTSPAFIPIAKFGSPSVVYAATDSGTEFVRAVRIDVAGGKMAPLLAKVRGNAESLSVSTDGKLVAFAANEEGVGTLHVYDTELGRERPLRGLPVGSVLTVKFRPNSTELAFDVVSAKHPRDVFSVDVATSKVSRWTAGELNGLNGEQLVDAELIRWKSFDQLEITGFLYRPPKTFTGRRPVMINIHGGPVGQERPRFLGFSNYFVNELGVALIYPNVRGSSGFGRAFVDADNGLNREGPVKDIGALLEWIAAQPDLDPARVMVTGISYGGYMSYAVATTYPERIKCLLVGAGISNLATDLDNTAPAGKDVRRGEYGDERDSKIREFLERIAPINHAPKLQHPLFIAHGQNDTRVPLAQAEQMAAAVEKNGKPVWFLLVKDEGHALGARRGTQDYLFSAWALFVQEYLVE